VKRLDDFEEHFHAGNRVLRGGQDLFFVGSCSYSTDHAMEHNSHSPEQEHANRSVVIFICVGPLIAEISHPLTAFTKSSSGHAVLNTMGLWAGGRGGVGFGLLKYRHHLNHKAWL